MSETSNTELEMLKSNLHAQPFADPETFKVLIEQAVALGYKPGEDAALAMHLRSLAHREPLGKDGSYNEDLSTLTPNFVKVAEIALQNGVPAAAFLTTWPLSMDVCDLSLIKFALEHGANPNHTITFETGPNPETINTIVVCNLAGIIPENGEGLAGCHPGRTEEIRAYIEEQCNLAGTSCPPECSSSPMGDVNPQTTDSGDL